MGAYPSRFSKCHKHEHGCSPPHHARPRRSSLRRRPQDGRCRRRPKKLHSEKPRVALICTFPRRRRPDLPGLQGGNSYPKHHQACCQKTVITGGAKDWAMLVTEEAKSVGQAKTDQANGADFRRQQQKSGQKPTMADQRRSQLGTHNRPPACFLRWRPFRQRASGRTTLGFGTMMDNTERRREPWAEFAFRDSTWARGTPPGRESWQWRRRKNRGLPRR